MLKKATVPDYSNNLELRVSLQRLSIAIIDNKSFIKKFELWPVGSTLSVILQMPGQARHDKIILMLKSSSKKFEIRPVSANSVSSLPVCENGRGFVKQLAQFF
jgi:hypothetical protein